MAKGQSQDSSKPLHSIALEASASLKVGPRGLVLDPGSEVKLREKLVLSFGSPEMEWAVRSLLLVAARVEKRNGREAAAALVKIAAQASQAMSQRVSESAAGSRSLFGPRASAPTPIPIPIPIPIAQVQNRLVANRLMMMPRRA